MRLSHRLTLGLLLIANGAIAQTTTYDSTQKVDTNNTSTSTSTVTSTNTNNNVNTSTSTATTNNTNTSTNTNYNVNSGTQTINNNNSISSTSTSTNVNTNNNINSGDMTVRNINTGDMTNRNINTTTSNNTNTNNNINTGDMTNRNINTTTSTSVNTNNNINSGTQTFNNNNISSSNNNNVNTSTSSNVNTNIQQGEMTNRNINETRMRVEQPPPTAIAPAMMSGGNNDLCTTGTSGAVQTQILGVSSGGTVRDLNCERLKNAKTLYDMGMKVAAVATMCQDRRVFDAMWHAGTPCPYEGTIGEQARVAWIANPDKMPKSEEPKGDDFYKKTGFGAVLGAVLLSLVR